MENKGSIISTSSLEKLKLLLFNNSGVRQTIVKNFFWLSLAEFCGKLIKIIPFIYIARKLGAHEYGKFSFALSFVGLFTVMSDLTISKIVTREFAKDIKKEQDFPAILSLEVLLSLLTFVVIVIGSFFITNEVAIQYLIWVTGLYLLVNIFPEIFFSFFRARQKMEYQAWLNVLSSAVTAAVVLVAVIFIPSVINLSFAYLISACVSLMVVIFLFYWKIGHLGLVWDYGVWKKYLGVSWPLVASGLVQSLFVNFDVTFLGHLGQYDQAGAYSASQKLVSVSLIPAGLIAVCFYPALSKVWAESEDALKKIWKYFFGSIFFVTIPAVVGGFALAEKITSFLYGSNFNIPVVVFRFLLISSMLLTIVVPFRSLLVIANKLKQNLIINSVAAVLNITLNFFLIKKYSLHGAVVSNVLTAMYFGVAFFVTAKKHSKVSLFNQDLLNYILIFMLSGGLMYMVFFLLRSTQLNILFILTLGLISYGVSAGILIYFFTKLKNRIWT